MLRQKETVTLKTKTVCNGTVESCVEEQIEVGIEDPFYLIILLNRANAYSKLIAGWKKRGNYWEEAYRKERNFRKSRWYQEKSKLARSRINSLSRKLDDCTSSLLSLGFSQ